MKWVKNERFFFFNKTNEDNDLILFDKEDTNTTMNKFGGSATCTWGKVFSF